MFRINRRMASAGSTRAILFSGALCEQIHCGNGGGDVLSGLSKLAREGRAVGEVLILNAPDVRSLIGEQGHIGRRKSRNGGLSRLG